MPPELLSRLKHETAACHARLEGALDLMRAGLRRDEYIALLERFYGFVAPWEEQTGAGMPAHLQGFFDARRKTALLEADLAELTGDPGHAAGLRAASAGSSKSGGAALPRVASLGGLFGSMYVMEGSTLGGRFIAPHVAQVLALAPRRGNAYFEGYGPRTGSMWKAFGETAQATVPARQYDDAVRAAIATFDALHDWLCPRTGARPAAASAGVPA
jgi:heme oxygenase